MKYKSLIHLCIVFVFMACSQSPKDAVQESKPVKTSPDYNNIVVPVNIAPLNFKINKDGDYFHAKFDNGTTTVTIANSKGKIVFPEKKWHKFLQNCKNDSYSITISILHDKKWTEFPTITNHVAEEIDPVLVYRLIDPVYHIWSKLGIYQRDLTTFSEKAIFHNEPLGHACINCHSFCQNDPDKMLLHVRGGPGTSMLLSIDGKVQKINTATEFNRATAYRCWHPNGKLVAFSSNKVTQFFHAKGEIRDVYDIASDLVLYDIEKNMITTSQVIAEPDEMETYPMWSADGKTLYFCSAPVRDFSDPIHKPVTDVFYSLYKIGYDPETNEFGDVQLVINADTVGKSITHPSVSPDGKYMIFCMAEYGNFSIYRPGTDLYLLDLATEEIHELNVNSNHVESYHSWSSNGRWFVFSSKRDNGVTARPYFSYFKDGQASKPFILPQKDPSFYEAFIKTYNVPEMVKGEVKIKPYKLTNAEYGTATNVKMDEALKPLIQDNDEPEVSPWRQAPQ